MFETVCDIVMMTICSVCSSIMTIIAQVIFYYVCDNIFLAVFPRFSLSGVVCFQCCSGCSVITPRWVSGVCVCVCVCVFSAVRAGDHAVVGIRGVYFPSGVYVCVCVCVCVFV